MKLLPHRMLVTACLAAALLATPALAEPANEAELQFIGRTPDFWYFVSRDPVVREGDILDAWIFAAPPKATPMDDGRDAAGGWLHVRYNCRTGAMADLESVTMSTEPAVMSRSAKAGAFHAPNPDSPLDRIGRDLCGGALEHPDAERIVGLAAAIARARTPPA